MTFLLIECKLNSAVFTGINEDEFNKCKVVRYARLKIDRVGWTMGIRWASQRHCTE